MSSGTKKLVRQIRDISIDSCMTKFERAYIDLSEEYIDKQSKLLKKYYTEFTEEQIKNYMRDERSKCIYYKNNKYQVAIRKVGNGMLHLSIKRIDKEPIHDWRDLQQIKNELVGPKNEGVELYPSEDRLVDGANQYHMYVFEDASKRFDFGFTYGRMVDYTEDKGIGSKQRGIE